MRNTMMRRGRIPLFGTAILLLGLSGCVPFDGSAVPFIGVRSVNGEIVFTDCDPIKANEVQIRQGPEGGAPRDMEIVWLAASSEHKDAHQISSLTYGVAPEGMVASVGPHPIPNGSVIQYSAVRLDGTTVEDARQATFHLSLLSEDAWLLPNGKLVSDPCN
jgi:hypothetical protein